MADGSSTGAYSGGPSMKDKGKEKIGERRKRDDDSDEDDRLKNRRVGDDDKDNKFTEEKPAAGAVPSINEVQEEASGPGSRIFQTGDECLTKTLTPFDVIKENATLHISDLDAFFISGDRDIDKQDPRTYAKTMTVYDGINRKYVMVLSKFISRGRTHYTIGGEWKIFVRAHDLKAGDVVTFYEPTDENVYVIKYFRKPADRNIQKKI